MNAHRSPLAALAITAILSAPLVVLPVVGPVLAAWLGTRRSGRTAWVVGCLISAIWGGGLYWLSSGTVKVSGTEIALGPLSLLIPVICGGLIAGGLYNMGFRGGIAGTIVLLAGTLLTGYQLRPVIALVKQLEPSSGEPTVHDATCSDHLTKLYTAAQIYSDNWDGMLPPADRWQDALQVTLSDPAASHCPVLGPDGNGYAINAEAAGKRLVEISTAKDMPLFFDSDLPGPNASGGLGDMPTKGRHGGKNNIVYTDGRVVAIRAVGR